MNLPNWITVFRFLLAIAFYAVMSRYAAAPESATALRHTGLLIFVLAAVSDFVDGYIARKWKLTTRWGAVMDPLADKTLALIVLWFLVTTPSLRQDLYLPLLWAVCAFALLRELLILGGICLLKLCKRPPEIAPTRSGKGCTAIQFVTLALLLLGIGRAGDFFLLLSLFFLIWSGTEYALQGLRLLKRRE